MRSVTRGACAGEGAVEQREAPVDVTALMARLGGDTDLLGELVPLYFEDETEQLDRLAAALDRGDAEGVRRAAHAIKGCVSNFSASRAQAAALAVETAGRGGNLADAAGLLPALRLELAAVRAALRELTKENVEGTT